MTRRTLPAAVALVGVTAVLWLAGPRQAHAQSAQSVSRTEAIEQLRLVRASIDHTLSLIKEGRAQEAFAEARAGYLNHFELVEIPLRIVDPGLTSDAETMFAEIRGLISDGAPVSEIRAKIVELRGLIDSAERKLTDTGVGAPLVVASQSFVIIFREGLEAVLLLSALLGYLESAKATRYRRPIMWGMGLAAVATVVTFFAIGAILGVLPFRREVLEAITAIVAVLMLFSVSFWLIARLEHRRWMEFLRTRVWNAASVGSTVALVLIGFTAIYREGFETALFYQALMTFGAGLGQWVALGLLAGLIALAGVSFAIFRLGRRLPVKAFLTAAVTLLMVTSVAFLGNAVRSLQEADVIRLTPLNGWPRAPIFVAQALGYWPSRQTVGAQGALAAVYITGALYMFLVRPRLRGGSRPQAVGKKPEETTEASAPEPAAAAHT